MSDVTIYGLFDPRNPTLITYVGYTEHPDERLAAHRQDFHKGYSKSRWVAELRAQHIMPDMVTLEVVPYEQRKEAECRWIARWLELNQNLLNSAPGGSGPPNWFSDEWRAARSSAMKRSHARPEVREKLTHPKAHYGDRFLYGPRLENGHFTPDRRDLRPDVTRKERIKKQREKERRLRAEHYINGLCTRCGGKKIADAWATERNLSKPETQRELRKRLCWKCRRANRRKP